MCPLHGQDFLIDFWKFGFAAYEDEGLYEIPVCVCVCVVGEMECNWVEIYTVYSSKNCIGAIL